MKADFRCSSTREGQIIREKNSRSQAIDVPLVNVKSNVKIE